MVCGDNAFAEFCTHVTYRNICISVTRTADIYFRMGYAKHLSLVCKDIKINLFRIPSMINNCWK